MLTDHEIQKAFDWFNQDYSKREIARRIGVSEATIRRVLAKSENQVAVPDSKFDLGIVDDIVLDKPITHIGEAIITADWHFPLFSPTLGNQVLEIAKTNNIKTLVIGGDLFNMDALSRFEPKQESADLWKEIQVTLDCMSVLVDYFDKIYIIKGNHDERLSKALGFKLQFKQAIRLVLDDLGDKALEKIEISNLDHMWIRPEIIPPYREVSTISWYVCHPTTYTQVALAKTRLLADKLNTNVITAHSHHFAQGWARDGKKIVAEVGGLFDSTKTEYLASSTSYPQWVNGFMWLQYEKETKFNRLLGLRSPENLWVPRNN